MTFHICRCNQGLGFLGMRQFEAGAKAINRINHALATHEERRDLSSVAAEASDTASLNIRKYKKPALARRRARTGYSVDHYLNSKVHRVAVSVHQQESVGIRAADGVLEIGGVLHRFVIDFLNHIALPQTGLGGFTRRANVGYHYALCVRRELQVLRRLSV